MKQVYYKYQNEYINDLETLKRDLCLTKLVIKRLDMLMRIIKQISTGVILQMILKDLILNSRTGY